MEGYQKSAEDIVDYALNNVQGTHICFKNL